MFDRSTIALVNTIEQARTWITQVSSFRLKQNQIFTKVGIRDRRGLRIRSHWARAADVRRKNPAMRVSGSRIRAQLHDSDVIHGIAERVLPPAEDLRVQASSISGSGSGRCSFPTECVRRKTLY